MKKIVTKAYKEAQRAIGYPFAEKEKQYREYTDEQLIFALQDARDAAGHQDEIEREFGENAHAGKNHGWRWDDYHTIAKIMMERGLVPASDELV